MSVNNIKKEKGVGTFALALGLLPTALTAQYNGVSLLKLTMDTAHLTYTPWMAAFGLILSVPGLFLGLSNKEDYGARFGAFLCGLNAVTTFVQFGMAYLV